MADDAPSVDDLIAQTQAVRSGVQGAASGASGTPQAPSVDDLVAQTRAVVPSRQAGPPVVADASAAKPGDIDPITGKPYQFASSGTPGPVGASTGTPIRDDMVPGAGTQAIISLAGDPEQKRRIAAAQLFPNLKPLEAQSRLFYGPNGRLAAVGDDGTAYYVDPAARDTTVLGVPVPSNPLAYAGSNVGPSIAPAAGTATSALAAPASIVAAPLAGAAGAAAGDILRQNLAAKFDPGSPKYDPKATLGAAGTGAVIGATSAVGNALAESGPAISGVPALPPKVGAAPPAVGTQPSGPTFLNNTWMRNAGATGQGFDMGKGGAALTSQVSDALARGDTVQLVTDGGNKTVGITGLNRQGMMVDANGQPWGSASIAFDGSGREGLRITPSAGAPPPGPKVIFPLASDAAPATPPPGGAVVPSAVGPASRNPAITQDIPTSSAAAEALAKPYYKMAETSGAGSTSQGTDAIIGLAEDKLPTGLVGEARGGAVPDFVKWVQQFQGKPLTYEDLSNIDKELGQRISDDYTFPKGLSDQGKDLFDIQTAIRQRLLNPQPGDLSGDPSGFAAKQAGDKAWAQAKKMEDVENMWAKANDTQNADTSFANQVRNYKFSAKSRGWSDDEIAALDAAAKGGVGSIMHVLGSRMLEHTLTAAGATIGGVLGAGLGPIGAVVGTGLGSLGAGVGSHIAGSLARRSAVGMTGRGVENALSVLGRGTPPSALTPPP